MAEFIEREAAINELMCMTLFDDDGAMIDETDVKRECFESFLNDVPTADVQPVLHGEWVAYPECLRYENAYSDDQIVCSVCGSVWNILDNCTEGFNYCPNCGAKMDGGIT